MVNSAVKIYTSLQHSESTANFTASSADMAADDELN
jgi:hypothetical protein